MTTSIQSKQIVSPLTGKPYEFCVNCGHIKQAHFCLEREHPCSNADKFPEFCDCKGWVKK